MWLLAVRRKCKRWTFKDVPQQQESSLFTALLLSSPPSPQEDAGRASFLPSRWNKDKTRQHLFPHSPSQRPLGKPPGTSRFFTALWAYWGWCSVAQKRRALPGKGTCGVWPSQALVDTSVLPGGTPGHSHDGGCEVNCSLLRQDTLNLCERVKKAAALDSVKASNPTPQQINHLKLSPMPWCFTGLMLLG